MNPENLKIVARMIWPGIKILGIKLIVRNEHILNNFPCVIVSNHQENMDVFVGARMIPSRCVSIGKKSIVFIPFFGLFYWLSGNILIDRKNKKSAHGTMDFAAKQIKEKNISVWVLAEGTRSKGRGLLPFKKGAFVTAIKAQVPVFPIAISTYKGVIDLKKFKAGKIIVEVCPPIETKHLSAHDVNGLKDQAHLVVKNKLNELDRELKHE
jgi:1-acyl-sn-glycerol-3-phosphate acyltransferase